MSTFPKVSAVMPVGHGATYFSVALACFLAQDYQGQLELVIVDNSAEPIESLLPPDDRIKYFRVDRQSVGALRNYGNAQSTGDLIVNWDEDDWSSSSRITEQVKHLHSTGRCVVGWHSIHYFNIHTGETFRYLYSTGHNHPPYAMGTSHLYTCEFWKKHPYPTTGIEDHPFQLHAMRLGQLASCDADGLAVARAHSDSVCFPRQLGVHQQFPAVAKDKLPAEFYAAINPQAPAPKAAKAKSKPTKQSQEK